MLDTIILPGRGAFQDPALCRGSAQTACATASCQSRAIILPNIEVVWAGTVQAVCVVDQEGDVAAVVCFSTKCNRGTYDNTRLGELMKTGCVTIYAEYIPHARWQS